MAPLLRASVLDVWLRLLCVSSAVVWNLHSRMALLEFTDPPAQFDHIFIMAARTAIGGIQRLLWIGVMLPSQSRPATMNITPAWVAGLDISALRPISYVIPAHHPDNVPG